MIFVISVMKSSATSMEKYVTNLKLWRLTNHLTQADAARRCGLGLSAYCLLEAGRLRPSPPQNARLKLYFGSDANALLDEASIPKLARVVGR
jgi:transcriptional regulator with XRE-family HTH domain